MPLYRELYAAEPPGETRIRLRRLPVLTAARLRATPVMALVDDVSDTLRAWTPLALATAPAAAPVLTDREDADAVFDEAREAFAGIGVRRGAAVVVLTPPWQRYTAAELAERLGYWGIRAAVVVDIEPGEALRALDALGAAHVVGLGIGRTRPTAERVTITVREPDAPGPDLYLVPEAGLVAYRPAGEQGYLVLKRSYLVQPAANERLLLTTLRRYHQPLIRFELPDRGRVAGGRLWLHEVVP